MRKIFTICSILLLFQGICFASTTSNGTTKDALMHIDSLRDVAEPITMQPGLTVSMNNFITQNSPYNSDKITASDYYYYKSKSWSGDVTYYFKEIVGFKVSFVNNSDNFYNIQWSGSNISFGNFSGIPFLTGMKYIDAGQPNSTPDTLLPPNTITTITLYTSDVEFTSNDWVYNGELIPTDNSMQLVMNLKIFLNNTPNYHTVKFSHIGIKNI